MTSEKKNIVLFVPSFYVVFFCTRPYEHRKGTFLLFQSFILRKEMSFGHAIGKAIGKGTMWMHAGAKHK